MIELVGKRWDTIAKPLLTGILVIKKILVI